MVFFAAPVAGNAVGTANPTLNDGTDIPNQADVTDTDPSGVDQLDYSTSVTIITPYISKIIKALRAPLVSIEAVVDALGANVIHCFNVTNNGDTYLDQVSVANAALNITDKSFGLLAPGQPKLIAVPNTINGNATNDAVVNANPWLKSGAAIAGALAVTDADTSAVGTPVSLSLLLVQVVASRAQPSAAFPSPSPQIPVVGTAVTPTSKIVSIFPMTVPDHCFVGIDRNEYQRRKRNPGVCCVDSV